MALEDICYSSWERGGQNLARINGDRLHSKVRKCVGIIKANVCGKWPNGDEIPKGWAGLGLTFSIEGT